MLRWEQEGHQPAPAGALARIGDFWPVLGDFSLDWLERRQGQHATKTSDSSLFGTFMLATVLYREAARPVELTSTPGEKPPS
jgi:hypothetical protein